VLKETWKKEKIEVSLSEAVGMVIAEDVIAPEPLPPFPASVMDGYAVRTEVCNIYLLVFRD